MKKRFLFFVFIILVAAAIINAVTGKDASDADTATTASVASGLTAPASQQNLIDLLIAQEIAYFDTTKHAEREALGKAQNAELCDTIGHQVTDWVGAIESLKTEAGQPGAVEIKVTDKLTLMTWSSSVADGQDGSLIAPGSSVFKALSGLKAGDTVRFSGRIAKDRDRCYRYANLSSRGRKKEPKLIVVFSEIGPL